MIDRDALDRDLDAENVILVQHRDRNFDPSRRSQLETIMIVKASVVHIIVECEKTGQPKPLTAFIAQNVNRPVIGDSCDLYMATLAIEDAVCSETAGLDSKAVLGMSHVAVAFVFHV